MLREVWQMHRYIQIYNHACSLYDCKMYEAVKKKCMKLKWNNINCDCRSTWIFPMCLLNPCHEASDCRGRCEASPQRWGVGVAPGDVFGDLTMKQWDIMRISWEKSPTILGGRVNYLSIYIYIHMYIIIYTITIYIYFGWSIWSENEDIPPNEYIRILSRAKAIEAGVRPRVPPHFHSLEATCFGGHLQCII